MKKIITSMCLILLVGLFVCSMASAHEDYCGVATITAIQLSASDCATDVPLAPCVGALIFPFPNGEVAKITATACGTQINLALLKAFNESESVYVCMYMAWDPLHGNTVTYVINSVSFPASPVFPVNSIGDAAALQ